MASHNPRSDIGVSEVVYLLRDKVATLCIEFEY